MNPEVKAAWVEALRSGDYGQAQGVLHEVTTDTYCCLGVLCDIAIKQGVEIEVRDQETSHDGTVTWYDGSFQMPPSKVDNWASIPTTIEIDVTGTELGRALIEQHKDDLEYGWDILPIEEFHPMVELTELNDTHGYTFEQLADLIEAQL
jgi:hypothetical protein